MIGFFQLLRSARILALMRKEFHQLRRNKRMVISLLLPPIAQILMFGFALNPEPHNLRLGIVDDSRTSASRTLISAFAESRSFQIEAYYPDSGRLAAALSAGNLDAGLV